MVADRVAGLRDPLHQVGVPLCDLADHEESRVRLMSLQNAKKTRGLALRRV
jgi:hypothetical protein